jgi:hypothetical protein
MVEHSHNQEIEELINQLNCPKGFKCHQSGHEHFAKGRQIDAGAFYLDCLEPNPLECPLFRFSTRADSFVCTCPVRTHVAEKKGARNNLK